VPKKTAKKSKPSKKKVAPKKVAKKKPSKREPTIKELARSAAKAGATVTISYEKKKEETMDRAALKAIASQLKEMGSDIKVFKSDTDEGLQKKVNEQLQKIPTGEILKKLETVSPDKLVTVLKRDCVGIFIDLSDVSCFRCKDSGKCASEFLKNVKGGFTALDKAMPEAKNDEKPAEKVKLKPASRYEEDRLVFVRDVKNPNPVGDPYHDTIQTILDEQPSTLGELREIAERNFDIDSDGDFMKFITNLRDPAEGVIKLDVDLTEKNKAELRKAGIEV
jgi:hypothetical protein